MFKFSVAAYFGIILRGLEFWSEFPHFMGMGVVPAPSNCVSRAMRSVRYLLLT